MTIDFHEFVPISFVAAAGEGTSMSKIQDAQILIGDLVVWVQMFDRLARWTID